MIIMISSESKTQQETQHWQVVTTKSWGDSDYLSRIIWITKQQSAPEVTKDAGRVWTHQDSSRQRLGGYHDSGPVFHRRHPAHLARRSVLFVCTLNAIARRDPVYDLKGDTQLGLRHWIWNL